jgi:hypothetical protein
MLMYVEFAINSTVAASTGKSPFEMVYGENVREPIDMLLENVNVPSAEELLGKIKDNVDSAKKNIARA